MSATQSSRTDCQLELSDADRYGFINVDGRLEESEALLLGLLQNTTRFHDGVI